MKTLILDTATSMTANGVTLTIERGEKGFNLVARKYRATIPACGCERTLCVGTCPFASKRVAEKDRHASQVCHGGWPGMHLEHVKVFAERLLKTFGPAARKPFASGTVAVPGLGGELPADIQAQLDIALAERKAQGLKPDVALRVPNVSIARGSQYARFLPLDGEETVTAIPTALAGGIWVVQCNAIRCRDERGRVWPISEHPNASMADREVERHKAWHTEQRTGLAPKVREGLMLEPAEMLPGDWYHNVDGWQQIALITPTPNQVTLYDATWRTSLGRIASLEHGGEYLIVRSAERPSWTPVYDVRKRLWVEP